MKILVAGIGNVFMGDDAFGCEVAQRLSQKTFPAGVDVVDFGIRGLDLSYTLMDDVFDVLILIDTVDRGEAPGTLYLIEPDVEEVSARTSDEPLMTPHGMDPASVLRFIASLGQRHPRVWIVGCQPQYLGGEQGHMGLSDAVAQAIEKAVAEVLALLSDLVAGSPSFLQDKTRSATAPGGLI
ncbi:hydrogenase maturation protease [Pseudomonas sp. NA-150]|uniref:hydrogenase maturation protease n=1 Tax=Pseudomonas sp. NA-150 TaxID=3367525 RepID=UPI0037CAB754